eukprot:4879688-Prymnesium_polylepis.1
MSRCGGREALNSIACSSGVPSTAGYAPEPNTRRSGPNDAAKRWKAARVGGGAPGGRRRTSTRCRHSSPSTAALALGGRPSTGRPSTTAPNVARAAPSPPSPPPAAEH